MKFSQEFRTELTKAVKLSGFITLLVFGVLMIQNRTSQDDQNRAIASQEDCAVDENGNPIQTQGRSVPPYERKPCTPKRQ